MACNDDRKRNVLGTLFSVLEAETVVDRVVTAAQTESPCGVAALAVHGLMVAASDTDFQARINAMHMVVPDGQPIRWALNLIHRAGLRERVYGPDLMLAVCDAASARQLPIYLYGSTAETLQALERSLHSRFPDLVLAGSRPSRFRQATEGEREHDLAEIRSSGAKIVFVGLGCPRQELWTYENTGALSLPVIGVGAAFDYHAGNLAEPPRWMMRSGLQWLYRFCQEPGRLWHRYLVFNTRFLVSTFLQATRLCSYNPATADSPLPARRPG